jgi:poly-gamma-glutamate synthesis protein (capsule biosynthesis protein)
MTGAATFAFIGDVIFDARAKAAADAGRPELVWGDVLPVVQGVDAVFANLENPITASQHRCRRLFKPVCLKSDPATVSLLKAANVAFVNIANNHTLDFGDEGLAETIGLLRGAGVAHAGAGPDIEAAKRSVLVEAGSMTVGVMALTDNTPAYAAGPARPGTNHVRIDDDPATLARLAGEVRSLRAAGAQIIVLSAHWGPNYRPWPSARFRRFARAAIDAGVDIFHGHSAHILQGIEMYGAGVILYDTGDFIDDTWWLSFVPRFTGGLFLVDIESGRVKGLRVVPVVMRPGRVDLAHGALARRVVKRLMRLSPPGPRSVEGGGTDIPFRHVLQASVLQTNVPQAATP